MIAITSTVALTISHWITPSRVRHGRPPPNSGWLSAMTSCDELFSIPPPPRGLVVGNTTQKGVSKMRYREVKPPVESRVCRHLALVFLQAALDQCGVDRELRQ